MLSLDNLTRCIIKVLVLGGQVHEHFTELGERKRRTAAGNQRIVALLLSVAARYEPCITEYIIISFKAVDRIHHEFHLLLIKMRSMRLVKAMEAKKEEEIMILKNQTLEHDLKHKSQDLASSTMNLLRKNEILLKIKDGIDLSIRHFEDDEKNRGIRELQKLKYEIRDNIEHDDDWKKFEQNFDVVYEDYLNRLGKKYPSLSIGDKKICAYLKMGLSSKDIAPLMNMSVHSVEMARYRLRKKLELDRSVNLSEFLQNF